MVDLGFLKHNAIPSAITPSKSATAVSFLADLSAILPIYRHGFVFRNKKLQVVAHRDIHS